MNYTTSIILRRVVYHREQYGCTLRIRRSRLNRGFPVRLKEEARIVESMTRWLRRCVQNEPVVIGTARIEIVEWWNERPRLGIVAPAYRNVKPEHRHTLAHRVDDSSRRFIELLELDR